MKIGILGSGRMARVLAPHWVRAGHEVVIGGRDPGRTSEAAAATGATAATLREAARTGEVIVLAVLYQGLGTTLAAAGAAEGVLRDKVVLDLTNPVETEGFTLVDLPEGSAYAAVTARTGARVVKALNMAAAEVWRDGPTYGGRPMTVLYAGEDASAKAVARRLVADTGTVPLDAGGAAQAAYLEPATAVLIRLLHGGADLTTVLQPTVADR